MSAHTEKVQGEVGIRSIWRKAKDISERAAGAKCRCESAEYRRGWRAACQDLMELFESYSRPGYGSR